MINLLIILFIIKNINSSIINRFNLNLNNNKLKTSINQLSQKINQNNYKTNQHKLNDKFNNYKDYISNILELEQMRQNEFIKFLKSKNKRHKFIINVDVDVKTPDEIDFRNIMYGNKYYLPNNYYKKLHMKYINHLINYGFKNKVKRNVKLIKNK